jgi:SHS2 domain-containing protein
VSEPSYEYFPHEADVGVRGRGPTLRSAFEQAALAVTGLVTDPRRVEPRGTWLLRSDAPDLRILLADFLNAVIFEISAHHRVFCRFEVTISETHLEARALGEHFDRARHEPGVDVKGATFTALDVRQTDSEWIAQCVVDV